MLEWLKNLFKANGVPEPVNQAAAVITSAKQEVTQPTPLVKELIVEKNIEPLPKQEIISPLVTAAPLLEIPKPAKKKQEGSAKPKNQTSQPRKKKNGSGSQNNK